MLYTIYIYIHTSGWIITTSLVSLTTYWWHLMGFQRGFYGINHGIAYIPSGNLTVAIENGPVEIVSFPMNSMVIFHRFLYVYQARILPTNGFSQRRARLHGSNRCSEHWTIPTSFDSLNLGARGWWRMAMFLWGYHGLKCRVYTEYTEYTIVIYKYTLYIIYIYLYMIILYVYIYIYSYR